MMPPRITNNPYGQTIEDREKAIIQEHNDAVAIWQKVFLAMIAAGENNGDIFQQAMNGFNSASNDKDKIQVLRHFFNCTVSKDQQATIQAGFIALLRSVGSSYKKDDYDFGRVDQYGQDEERANNPSPSGVDDFDVVDEEKGLEEKPLGDPWHPMMDCLTAFLVHFWCVADVDKRRKMDCKQKRISKDQRDNILLQRQKELRLMVAWLSMKVEKVAEEVRSVKEWVKIGYNYELDKFPVDPSSQQEVKAFAHESAVAEAEAAAAKVEFSRERTISGDALELEKSPGPPLELRRSFSL
jgi:hypothetical protein